MISVAAMNKHFTTSGPVVPSKHYCIDPMQRLDWEEIRYLIGAEKYFVPARPASNGQNQYPAGDDGGIEPKR